MDFEPKSRPAVNGQLRRAEFAALASVIDGGLSPLPPFASRLIQSAPDSFDDLRAGQIAVTVRGMRSAGEPVTFPLIGEKHLPFLTFISAELTRAALPMDAGEFYAEQVWQAFQIRRTRSIFRDALAALDASPSQSASIIQSARSALDSAEAPKDCGLTIRTPDELLAMEFDDGDRILGDRLLAQGQSLVIAGQGGLGKSRLLLQFIAACRAGLPFIGFETRGQEMKWLLLQAENSNRRLQKDLAALRVWIGEQHWPQVSAGIFIHTLEQDADNFLSLDNGRTQAAIRDLISKINPDGIAWDSLYNFGVGNLSSDEDMTATLLAIARLSKSGNPNRAIIVLHHALTGKAGIAKAQGFDRASFGRNSKILHQWARGQINVAPGLPDSNEVLVMTCGKCSNGKEFSPFPVRLNPETMVYAVDESFDLSAWQAEITGKKATATITVDRVRELCASPMSKADLAAKIRADCGCGKTASFNWIQRADGAGKLRWNKTAETYAPRL